MSEHYGRIFFFLDIVSRLLKGAGGGGSYVKDRGKLGWPLCMPLPVVTLFPALSEHKYARNVSGLEFLMSYPEEEPADIDKVDSTRRRNVIRSLFASVGDG